MKTNKSKLLKAVNKFFETHSFNDFLGEKLKFTDFWSHRENTSFLFQSQEIKATTENSGLFSYIIKDFCVEVRLWISENGVIVGEVSLRYDHHGGGSNGHKSNIELIGSIENYTLETREMIQS